MTQRLRDTNLWKDLLWVYRSPFYNNFIIFFEKLTKFVCIVLNTCDNVIVMCDFNINVNKDVGKDYNKLRRFLWYSQLN